MNDGLVARPSAPATEVDVASLRAQLRRCQAARLQVELRAHLLENALLVAEAEHALCCPHADG